MATSAYRTWVARGRPYRLATPIAEIKALARTAGVAWLGDLGSDDKRHLQADTPEDHTPFSATAWPAPLPGYVVTAIDLADGPHSDRLLAAARSGRAPWVKYLNFRRRNYSVKRDWEPIPSSDAHLHMSIRSDWCDRSIGTFNPFVDLVDHSGGDDDMTPEQDERLRRVEQTLGKFIQGAAMTGAQPGLPPDLNFKIVPNVALDEIRSTLAALSARPAPPTKLEIDYRQLAVALLAEVARGAEPGS